MKAGTVDPMPGRMPTKVPMTDDRNSVIRIRQS